MFCRYCGRELKSEEKCCSGCGCKVETDRIADEWFYIKNNIRYGPIQKESMLELIQEGYITRETLVWKKGMLNCFFLSRDSDELEKSGLNVSEWVWMWVVLIPVYLFIRSAKTDKKYTYAITWCAIFLFDLLL